MIFRAIKFACQLDFEIENKTLKAIIENRSQVQNTFNFIKNEKEGILVELFLGNIFKGLEVNPVVYFNYLNQTGLFNEFVDFYSKESGLVVKNITKIKPEDFNSFEKDLSYLLSSIVNCLDTEEKAKHFEVLAKKLAVSTTKKYSDFIINTEKLKYIC